MIRTRVGYAGGEKKNPTYHSLGGHTETVQLDYDPSKVTYKELLDVFFEAHNPSRNAWSTQYMNIVFYHDEEQKAIIDKAIKALERRTGNEVKTKVLPYTGFYAAEDYHQKHALQRYPEILRELREVYPSFDDFLASPAVTRLNAYLGGYGFCEDLKAEAEDLGLTSRTADTLSTVVCGRKGVVASCPVPK